MTSAIEPKLGIWPAILVTGGIGEPGDRPPLTIVRIKELQPSGIVETSCRVGS